MTGGPPEAVRQPERAPTPSESTARKALLSLRSAASTLLAFLQRIPAKRILVAGILVRLALAPLTSWTDDVYPFYRVITDMAGGLDPYQSSFYTYPPLFAYTLFPLFTLLGLFLNPESYAAFVPSMGPTAELTSMLVTTVTAPIFNLVLKLPLIGADLGVALLIRRWASDVYGQKHGRTALVLWFLNPLVIWVTAVQGQFDVIPVFFTLASGYLILRRRFLFGGISLGIAVLFKLFPFFLVVPFLFLILGVKRRGSESGARRGLPLQPLSFVLGLSLSLAALGIPLLLTRFIDVVLLRRSQFAPAGGFSPLFILHLDIWEGLPGAEGILAALPQVASPYFLVVPIVASMLTGIVLWRRASTLTRWPSVETLCVLSVVSMVALYSVLGLVNPQHLLWILPFLILVSPRWRSLGRLVVVISLAGLAYLFSLQGPAVFFYPLAVFTPLLNVESLDVQVRAYWALGGLISTRLQQDLLFAAGGIGYAALVAAAYYLIKGWTASTSPAEVPRVSSGAGHRKDGLRLARFTAAGVAFLVVSQAFVLSEGIPPAGVFGAADYDSSQSIVTVDLRGHGIYDTTYRIAVVGLTNRPEPLPIHLYYDDRYPVSNTSRPRIFGILDHLTSELLTAEHPSEIRMTDALALVNLLRGPPAVLIVAATALPQGVFFPDSSLMRDWIERGGILIWTGALIGRYMGTSRGRVIDMYGGGGESRWGPTFIMGFDPVKDERDGTGTMPTSWTDALDLRYPLTAWGSSLADAAAVDGLALGFVTEGPDSRTSLSVLPVGNGSVALFGNAPGPVFTYSAEDVIAHDIARLLISGILQNPSGNETALLGSREIHLARGEEARVFLPVELGFTPHLRVLVQSVSAQDSLMAFADITA